MRLGEVADRLATNPKTIRYYESVALTPEPVRTGEHLRPLRTIRQLFDSSSKIAAAPIDTAE